MQIAINCRSFLNKNYTGIGRYTFNLLKSLSEIDSENNYYLYAKRGIFNHNRRVHNFGVKNFFVHNDPRGWRFKGLLKKVDIYHSPSPDNLNSNGKTKIIVTVHDLIFKAFPQGHTQATVEETERQFNNIKEFASKIICCSQNTFQDLQKYFHVKKEKIALIYQGVDKNLFYLIGKEEEQIAKQVLLKNGIQDPFILSVGTIEPRKNIENLLHAFYGLKTRKNFSGKLVVVGMRGWLSEGLEALVKKLELKNDVIFPGFLTDQELRYFYNKAQVFVFPSFYEGFGFPIVEAFCCGTPVITSNVSSCPEVAQDAALLVNPYNPDDVARAIVQVLEDQNLQRTLREKGFKRAGDFNFRKTAMKTLEVYQEVYKES